MIPVHIVTSDLKGDLTEIHEEFSFFTDLYQKGERVYHGMWIQGLLGHLRRLFEAIQRELEYREFLLREPQYARLKP